MYMQFNHSRRTQFNHSSYANIIQTTQMPINWLQTWKVYGR